MRFVSGQKVKCIDESRSLVLNKVYVIKRFIIDGSDSFVEVENYEPNCEGICHYARRFEVYKTGPRKNLPEWF